MISFVVWWRAYDLVYKATTRPPVIMQYGIKSGSDRGSLGIVMTGVCLWVLLPIKHVKNLTGAKAYGINGLDKHPR